MKITAKKISEIIDGKIIGNPDTTISSFASIIHAKKGDLTFLADSRYKKYIQSTKASILISSIIPDNITNETTIIQVKEPAEKFSDILELLFNQNQLKPYISSKASIDKSITLPENIVIEAFCTLKERVIIGQESCISSNTFIGSNVKIGSNCKIGPNVSIYHDCEIGNNVIIHAGAVIGSDGFGFIPAKHVPKKMPQLGKVIIHNNVEIGANTTIDRGTLSNTIIYDYAKLDNLIQIAHNVEIGKNTLIAAQTAIAGSTKIGSNCMVGGQVAIAGHLKIGNNVKIAGKSGIINNVDDNAVLQGPMAYNIKDFQKSYVHFKNLPNIVNDINFLKKNIEITKHNKK